MPVYNERFQISASGVYGGRQAGATAADDYDFVQAILLQEC
jgi:hypothetical protein